MRAETVRRPGMAVGFAGWLALLLFWLALVGQVSPAELAAGAAAAAISSAAWHASFRRSRVFFRPRLQWLAQAWHVPKSLVLGTWGIFEVLADHLVRRRPASSQFLSIPFDAGRDDPASAARRALAVAYTTVTPDFIVLGIDRENGRLIYHRIRPSAVLQPTSSLGVRT